MSNFRDLIKRAMEIRQKYDEQNARDGYPKWTGLEKVAGLNGDVGDLAKLVMVKEGRRRAPENINVDHAIEHELSDVLWQTIDIAATYNINLEKAFLRTMNELDERLAV